MKNNVVKPTCRGELPLCWKCKSLKLSSHMLAIIA